VTVGQVGVDKAHIDWSVRL